MKRDVVAVIIMIVAILAMCTSPARAETREKEGFATPGGAMMAGVDDALYQFDAVRINCEQLVIDRTDRKTIKVKIETSARGAGRKGEFPLSELSVSAKKCADGLWRVDKVQLSYVVSSR